MIFDFDRAQTVAARAAGFGGFRDAHRNELERQAQQAVHAERLEVKRHALELVADSLAFAQAQEAAATTNDTGTYYAGYSLGATIIHEKLRSVL